MMFELSNLWLFLQVLGKILWMTGLGPAFVVVVLIERRLYGSRNSGRLFLVPRRKRYQPGRVENLLLGVRPQGRRS
jgi:hypothetical protein